MKRFDKIVSLLTIAFLILLLAKICCFPDIPWIIVVLPLWLPTAAIAFLAVVVNILKWISNLRMRKKRENRR